MTSAAKVSNGKHGSAGRGSENFDWDSESVDLMAPLTRVKSTRGILRKHADAFPVAEVSEILELSNINGSGQSWFAATLIGISNQLQILDPTQERPVHVLSIPEGHDGGIGSMAWDTARGCLILSSANHIYSWSLSSPEELSKITTVEEATYLYGINLDAAGKIWMGSYPTGSVYSFDRDRNSLESTGKLSPDTDYTRQILLDQFNNVWVGTGSKNPRLFVVTVRDLNNVREVKLPTNVETGFISSLHSFGDYLVVSASGIREQLIYNIRTNEWGPLLSRVWSQRKASNSVFYGGNELFYTVTDGILYRTNVGSWSEARMGDIPAGQILNLMAFPDHVVIVYKISSGIEVLNIDPNTMDTNLSFNLSIVSGSYAIQSLLGTSTGQIYLGSFMGRGISAIDADTSERWSSPEGESTINQVEAMIEVSDQLFIGSYGYADLIRVNLDRRDDPEAYDRLIRLDHKYNQSRPFGWAANSESAFFGTVPDYGLSGGVFGKISLQDNEVDWVLDGNGNGFIDSHSIIGLVADEKFVYGTTSVRNGYGTPDTKGRSKVFKFDIANKRILWITTPVVDAGALYSPKLVGRWLIVADIEGVAVIDPNNGAMVRKHRLSDTDNSNRRPGWASADIALSTGGKIVHSAADVTTVVDFLSHTKSTIGSRESKHKFGYRVTALPDGRVFGVYNDTALVEFDLTPSG
ncbi:hypothetical protein [Glutamicibacter arilaitensis]|uniref:hypothetical protein n=1 Tax=Glutamicibacter arilaitensis TaxID=256701 RepID=UPI003A8EBAC6